MSDSIEVVMSREPIRDWNASSASPTPVARIPAEVNLSISQWGADSNDRFRPTGPSHPSVPAGLYRFDQDDRGIYIQKMALVTDSLIELDDEASARVLASIRKFWDSKFEYTSRGIIYKRGILLWGPAGSGKTSVVMLLTQELIRRGGIVIHCGHPGLVAAGLPLFRRIEPDRPLIIIFEDIEEMIRNHGEHNLLALLDGELQIDNVVNLATTNYPEQLGARIANRPSRFDERIFVGMPTSLAREKYLRAITHNEYFPEPQLRQWVKDTDTFSVAHLRELVVAVFCLKQEYADVLSRLKDLSVQPKSTKEFKGGLAGFAATIGGGGR